MNRLEFNEETPVPVIKGTNYGQAFANRDAVKKRIEEAKAVGPTDLTGPYSALFDWKEEQAKLEAQKEKAQLTQMKIMRTNAIGEAFRILGEGISAGKGAPVTQRNQNPFILEAVNEYAKSDIDYINKLEGVKAKKLALAQADIQYNLNQDAASLAKAERKEERSHDEAKQAEKELDDYIRGLRLQENSFRLRGIENKANAVKDQIKLGEEAAAQIAINREKERNARGMNLSYENEKKNTVDIRIKPDKASDAMEFVVPDTKKTVYLPWGTINHIRTFLQHGKGQYDQSVPAVLRDAMKNDAIKPESLYTAISDSWDYIKTNILQPDIYAQIYGGEPGQDTVQAGGQTATADSTATQQTTGMPTNVDWEELLLDNIETIFNDSSIKDMDQLFKVRDNIVSSNKENGVKINLNDAMLQAKEMKQSWRVRQRSGK